jgi:hypothetical protein
MARYDDAFVDRFSDAGRVRIFFTRTYGNGEAADDVAYGRMGALGRANGMQHKQDLSIGRELGDAVRQVVERVRDPRPHRHQAGKPT